jgi:hypothetical protein
MARRGQGKIRIIVSGKFLLDTTSQDRKILHYIENDVDADRKQWIADFLYSVRIDRSRRVMLSRIGAKLYEVIEVCKDHGIYDEFKRNYFTNRNADVSGEVIEAGYKWYCDDQGNGPHSRRGSNPIQRPPIPIMDSSSSD